MFGGGLHFRRRGAQESESTTQVSDVSDDASTVRAAASKSGDGDKEADSKSQDKPSDTNKLTNVALAAVILAFAIIVGFAVRDTRLQNKIKDLQLHKPVEEWIAGLSDASGNLYDQGPDRPGKILHEEGVRAKYPIILIPGFVTSGLELWEGHECAKGMFRTRLWTQMHMARAFLNDRICWMSHLSLNFTTGLDPRGVRVRNAQGLDAIDFFFPGYDVWAKVVEALADIGYDSSSMLALPYDWRLSIPNMEKRDGYFTKLEYQVEMFKRVYQEKVLLAAHSWGDNVARAFLHWMEERRPGWVEEHIAVHFNIAGPTLGVPKAATALLSGELKETSQLAGISQLVGETLLGKEDRTMVWRTWGSAVGMLPIGGSRIWGNATWAPDDEEHILEQGRTFGAMLTVMAVRSGSSNATITERFMDFIKGAGLGAAQETADQQDMLYFDAVKVVTEILRDAGPIYLHHVRHWSSAYLPDNITDIVNAALEQVAQKADYEMASTPKTAHAVAKLIKKVGTPGYPLGTDSLVSVAPVKEVTSYDPLKVPLPNAPSMRIYCGYGYGIPTERSYHYTERHPPTPDIEPENADAVVGSPKVAKALHAEGQFSAGTNWHINTRAHAPDRHLENGVEFSDGDGTVPLLSLGGMCSGGWQTKKLNPSGMTVTVREYQNNLKSLFERGGNLRGGAEASAHVEVLGNKHFLRDLLYVAAGWHDHVETHIGSNITRIANSIDWTSK